MTNLDNIIETFIDSCISTGKCMSSDVINLNQVQINLIEGYLNDYTDLRARIKIKTLLYTL